MIYKEWKAKTTLALIQGDKEALKTLIGLMFAEQEDKGLSLECAWAKSWHLALTVASEITEQGMEDILCNAISAYMASPLEK